MATDWYWLEQNEERGPVSFQELALMIQKRILNEDDLVRPHYAESWEKTYRVIGLFYMAKRVAICRPEETSPTEILSSQDCEPTQNDQRCPTERPISNRHDKDGEEGNSLAVAEGAAFEDIGQGVAQGMPQLADVPNHFAVVVTEAVKDWDRRHAGSARNVTSTKRSYAFGAKLIEPFLWCGSVATTAVGRVLDGLFRAGKLLRIGTLAGVMERLASRQVLSWWFRGGVAIATGLFVGWGAKTWAYYETVRYPNPARAAAGMSMFPLFGSCSPAEYYFLLTDVMIGGAVLGFFFAIYMEKMADA